jgi:integrase
LRRIAAKAGVRRRFAPHQLRHAHAVEMAREGLSLNVIQRQLGHVNLGMAPALAAFASWAWLTWMASRSGGHKPVADS